MKKTVFSAALAAFCLAALSPLCRAEDISAGAAIVYEPFSQTVLYEKNADERCLIASTTKIMTALVVLENCALDEKVEVSPVHAAVEGSSMYLVPGGDYTVEQLLLGLMLASGNDAAAALAEHCSGSMEAFADAMNEKCEMWGLSDTHFVNSHGLDAEGQYSTARELAVITAKAMENEDFCRIFSTRHCSVNGQSYQNHNKLLSICPGCIGGKTGYTEKAGRILVSCVEREGMRLICVTISDPRDWDDHMELYDKCFGEYEFVPLPAGSIAVISGRDERLCIKGEKGGFVAEKGKNAQVELHLPQFVFAPVQADEALGWAELDSEVVELLSGQSVAVDESQRLTAWEKFKRVWYMVNRYSIYYPNF